MDEIPDARSPAWLAVANEVASLLNLVDSQEFADAVDRFRDPERTWFFTGQGRSGLVAAMAAMRFMHLARSVHSQGEPTCPAIAAGDGIVVVSGSGRTPVSLHFAEVAKTQGAAIVLVTHERDAPLARLADTVLTIPAKDSLQFGGSLFEQAALLVLDAIVLELRQAAGIPHAEMKRRHANLR